MADARSIAPTPARGGSPRGRRLHPGLGGPAVGNTHLWRGCYHRRHVAQNPRGGGRRPARRVTGGRPVPDLRRAHPLQPAGLDGLHARAGAVDPGAGGRAPRHRVQHTRRWHADALRLRTDVAPDGTLDPEWRALFVRHPDRFMVGTDTWTTSRWESVRPATAAVQRWLLQLPRDVAEQIAWKNGERLFPPP